VCEKGREDESWSRGGKNFVEIGINCYLSLGTQVTDEELVRRAVGRRVRAGEGGGEGVRACVRACVRESE